MLKDVLVVSPVDLNELSYEIETPDDPSQVDPDVDPD